MSYNVKFGKLGLATIGKILPLHRHVGGYSQQNPVLLYQKNY